MIHYRHNYFVQLKLGPNGSNLQVHVSKQFQSDLNSIPKNRLCALRGTKQQPRVVVGTTQPLDNEQLLDLKQNISFTH